MRQVTGCRGQRVHGDVVPLDPRFGSGNTSRNRVSRSVATTCPPGPTWPHSQRAIDPRRAHSRHRHPAPTPARAGARSSPDPASPPASSAGHGRPARRCPARNPAPSAAAIALPASGPRARITHGSAGAVDQHPAQDVTPAPGYSHVVTGTGRLVAVSGQVAIGEDGQLVGPATHPRRPGRCLRTCGAAWRQRGCPSARSSSSPTTSPTWRTCQAVRAVRDEFIDTDRPLASTAVQAGRWSARVPAADGPGAARGNAGRSSRRPLSGSAADAGFP